MRGGLMIAALTAIVVLAGCSAPRSRTLDVAALEAQLERERKLAGQPSWRLTGRVAVTTGRDGGSGRLVWEQGPQAMRFEVQAPVSRQSWRLTVTPGSARLEGLEGGDRESPDPQSLVREAIGWDLPLEDLAAWVRGARGPGAAAIDFSETGLPLLIEQRGWRVEYRSWNHAVAPPLPTRVFASKGGKRVRVAIDRWDRDWEPERASAL